jgi:hypothetical protein
MLGRALASEVPVDEPRQGARQVRPPPGSKLFVRSRAADCGSGILTARHTSTPPSSGCGRLVNAQQTFRDYHMIARLPVLEFGVTRDPTARTYKHTAPTPATDDDEMTLKLLSLMCAHVCTVSVRGSSATLARAFACTCRGVATSRQLHSIAEAVSSASACSPRPPLCGGKIRHVRPWACYPCGHRRETGF